MPKPSGEGVSGGNVNVCFNAGEGNLPGSSLGVVGTISVSNSEPT